MGFWMHDRGETEEPVFFTDAGDPIRVGTWVVGEYEEAPYPEPQRIAGEVTFMDAPGGRGRLTLVTGITGMPERMLWVDGVVDTGYDAE